MQVCLDPSFFFLCFENSINANKNNYNRCHDLQQNTFIATEISSSPVK